MAQMLFLYYLFYIIYIYGIFNLYIFINFELCNFNIIDIFKYGKYKYR
jgi:hypothetical protein